MRPHPLGGPLSIAAGFCFVLGACVAPKRDAADASRGDRTTPSAVAAPTVAGGSISASLGRGIEWLCLHQNADGSWGSFESARPGEIYLGTVASHRAFKDATSALATMALLPAAERGDADARRALERGVSYLLSTEPSLRATGDTFYNVWTHTYLVQAAARVIGSGLLPDRQSALRSLLAREVSMLAATQAADGGWGYYDFNHAAAVPSGDMTTSFNTASVLLALRDAEGVGVRYPEARLDDAVAVIERLRLPSGAYVYGTYALFRPAAGFNMVQGSLARSQPCNLALHLFGDRVSLAEVEAGLDAMRREHRYLQIGQGRPRPHEAYYQNSGYYYLYGHWYAAENAALLESPASSEYAPWLEEVLAGIQNPDGSWLDFPLYGYGHPYGTAFAVLALERCRDVRGR
ncbi:MAG: hypothetical protein ACO3EP_01870 [Phycisphaerales bacterium]